MRICQQTEDQSSSCQEASSWSSCSWSRCTGCWRTQTIWMCTPCPNWLHQSQNSSCCTHPHQTCTNPCFCWDMYRYCSTVQKHNMRADTTGTDTFRCQRNSFPLPNASVLYSAPPIPAGIQSFQWNSPESCRNRGGTDKTSFHGEWEDRVMGDKKKATAVRSSTLIWQTVTVHLQDMAQNGNIWQFYLVLGSPVQSGLLSKFDKTGTRTGPHRLKNHEKLNWTNINWFSVVLVSFLWLNSVWKSGLMTGKKP